MRIIGGSRRGKKLKFPDTMRPTRDFVKEALFNIIGSCKDLVIMDVCAGSGALGIEALSRGAKKVIFIEKDPHHCQIIQENLEGFDATRYEIICQPFEKTSFLKNTIVDIIFFDPPYDDHNAYQAIVQMLWTGQCLIIESNAHDLHLDQNHIYELKDTRKYGTTYLYFFKKKIKTTLN